MAKKYRFSGIYDTIKDDKLMRIQPMAKLKSSYTRHNVWPGVKAYIEYVEHLGKHYNAEDGDFYDAIILDF